MQNRMQFDAILRNPDLVVVDVKKSYSLHPHQPCCIETPKMGLRGRQTVYQHLPRLQKLLDMRRTAGPGTITGRDLGNQGVPQIVGIGQHQVVITVSMCSRFLLPPQQDSLHGINMCFSFRARIIKHLRGRKRQQFCNADRARTPINFAAICIRKSLDSPTFGPAMYSTRNLRVCSMKKPVEHEDHDKADQKNAEQR